MEAMSDEQLVKDMVERYRKWDARGTPDPVIMNKILANIKPIIFKAGEDKGKQEGIKEVVEFTQPLLEEISGLVSNIRGDWTDPRSDCRKIWELIDKWQAFLKERLEK